LRFVHTADTHLGFDLLKRIPPDPEGRRRRAEAISANFRRVVDHAREAEAHLFIHSGDLFHSHALPREALESFIRPIADLARSGMPVVILPGNHDRSVFPFDLFHGEKNIYVFDRPHSLVLTLNGYDVCLAGFPFLRNDSRRLFPSAMEETGYAGIRADLKILVTHQTFDGARCGSGGFTFTARRPDTFPRRELPPDLDYVAAGHIHLHQVLFHPLKPELKVVYPGSIQRMSLAERREPKGFVEAEVEGNTIQIRFRPLPTLEMEVVGIRAVGLTAQELRRVIRGHYWRFHADLVIRFQLTGGEVPSDYPELDFDEIRAEMPPVLECTFAVQVKDRWILK